MEDAIKKANEPKRVSSIPDIGLIRNEPRYRIDTIWKTDKTVRTFGSLYTKKEAMKIMEDHKKKDRSIRIWHMGETETGVPMKMIDASYRWKIGERR